MYWRKWLCFFVVAVGFLLWSGLAPVHASETALLINLLKKKNIITQQEADEILKELKTVAQQEKKEIKKEVKAEVKAEVTQDIKKDAGKGAFLPKSLQGFKLGGQIFAEWNAKNYYPGLTGNGVPTNVDTSSNEFALNRGQFTLSKDFNDWLGMQLTADVFYLSTDAAGATSTESHSGPELRLKQAFASMKYAGTTTHFGLVNTTSDDYDNSIWPFRVQGKNLLDELGIQSTFDLGVANQGVIGGYMDDEYLKYANRAYSGKWGGWRAGLFNGAGYTKYEGNNNKAASALVYFRPLPNTPFLKGLQLAYVGTWGQGNTFIGGNTAANQPKGYPNYLINLAQVSLLHPWFAVMGQYYWGQGTAAGNDDTKRAAYLASAYVRIPGIQKLRAFGKIYNYDPDTYREKDDYNVFVAGLAYDLSPEFMPFVAWEHRDNGQNVALGTSNSGRIDYHKYQVGVQVKF